jgi:pyroglutamyl-peptidase
MLGLAEGRSQISIERVAINLADFRIPDNAGDQLIDTPIVTDGPDAYFSTLPVAEMRAASSAAGAPTELSLTAGAYLCNYVFYLGRHLCEGALASTRVGFIHLPATPELALSLPRPVASMSLDTMMVGLRSALAVLVAELTAID